MIRSTGSQHHHWNYFIAIEQDLSTISRYIEFTEDNFNAYSIELAHILLSASSEVDVVLKQICKVLGEPKCGKIDQYREAIMGSEIGGRFAYEEIYIYRYDIGYTPFENWKHGNGMDWWAAYNKVKHLRNDNFFKANLQNVLNAVGALYIAVIYYYKLQFSKMEEKDISFADVILRLSPRASLLRITGDEFTIRVMRV